MLVDPFRTRVCPCCSGLSVRAEPQWRDGLVSLRRRIHGQLSARTRIDIWTSRTARSSSQSTSGGWSPAARNRDQTSPGATRLRSSPRSTFESWLGSGQRCLAGGWTL